MSKLLTEVAPAQYVSTPVQTTIGAAAVRILAPNAKRKGLLIQNTGTTIIRLSFGSTDPTQTVYQVALAACTAADDGLGAAYFDDAWVGEVRAISSAAAGTIVTTEFQAGGPDLNASGDLY